MTSKGLTERFVGKSNDQKKLLDVPGGTEPNLNQRKKVETNDIPFSPIKTGGECRSLSKIDVG